MGREFGISFRIKRNLRARGGGDVPGCLTGAEVTEELGGVDGLGKQLEVIAAGTGAGEDFNRRGLAAEENDPGFGKEVADGDGSLDAVELRHENVGEDDLRVKVLGEVDGLLATVDGLSLEAVAVEDVDEGIRDERLVVDDEDAWASGGKLRETVGLDGGRHGRLGRT
jgi:hypothetical protein